MKRKVELDHVNFFKKHKIENTRDSFVRAALTYEGKLQQIPGSGYYVSSNIYGANDFILNFCDSIGEIPDSVKKAVENKFLKTKQNPAVNAPKERYVNKNNLHLSCWDFCFLVLNDIGLVTKNQLDDLCYIIYKTNQKNFPDDESNDAATDDLLTMAHALFKLPYSNYKDYSSGKLPSAGDLLIYKKFDKNRPYHCAIATDNDGGLIGLEDECVGSENIRDIRTIQSNYEMDFEDYDPIEDEIYAPGNIYYVPLEQIAKNVCTFIENNIKILALKKIEPKEPEEKLIKALIHTQHDDLVNNTIRRQI